MPAGPQATFLTLPVRSKKPRCKGLTHVLDKGCTLLMTQEVLSSVAGIIDIWKFGWGTAYLDPAVRSKVDALHAAQVKACTGGTLLEVAWMQGRTEEFFEFAADVGFDSVEVSDGATTMQLHEKRELIRRGRELGFVVLAEVGSKDPERMVSPEDWEVEIEGDMAAGANWIVTEGRESGTVGLYDKNGDVRHSLLEVLEQSVYASRIIYEAPQRAQQSVLLRQLGSEVSLGNIALEDVMSLEALRLGLRADTLGNVSGEIVLNSERGVGV
ncbi:phosphosulfolactate synthase [Paraburkholderia hospita]|uniref:Phosphosulfolactate synthase n=1 Tax=Paraburkholderia hospita TaxID=169430 RepID=A0ABP2PSL9_9BURK|nr:phosphosulfolactate synthase [Paraburkholderia hospita]EIN00498.1 phosphosulfolactate synthase [Paraburkholderia hospita]OUL88227.1 phosphohydrolase [Paraburkholderia hospita]